MAAKSENSGCLIVGGVIAIFLALGLFSGDGAGLGFLFLIGGIIVLVMGINASNATSNANSNPSHSIQTPALAQANPSNLQLMVLLKPEQVEGMPMNLLHFHTKGIFSNHRRILRPCFEFRMSDITDAQGTSGNPVLCVIDELQDDNSTEFRFQQRFPRALDAGSGSFDWVQFASVPKELLVFPSTGNRRIRVVLKVTDTANSQLIATALTVWSTLVEGTGYLEMETQESEAQAASLQLAMCIAASDGTVDDDEVEVIKSWGERTVNSLPAARQAKRRQVLNRALQKATEELRAIRISQLESAAIQVLKNIGDPRFLYDAYELCLHVLKADGEAHPAEMAQLTRVARMLDLDETKVRILTDRHLSNVEFAPVDDDSGDDHFLGITDDMSKDEIRKHLNKLYHKHQARTTHDKPDVSRKAKEWLERIATARVRHLG